MLPDKPGIWQRKETDELAPAILNVYRGSRGSLFANELKSDHANYPCTELVGDWELLETQPPIIIGKGQQVGDAAGAYLRESSDGTITKTVERANYRFHSGYRYMQMPVFPPRPAVMPPKPRQIIIDHNLYRTDDGVLVWMRTDDQSVPRYWTRLTDTGEEIKP